MFSVSPPLFSGCAAALVTPFLPDGTLDEAALWNLIHMQLDAGADALVLLGTTGEASTLSMEERARVIRLGIETVAGSSASDPAKSTAPAGFQVRGLDGFSQNPFPRPARFTTGSPLSGAACLGHENGLAWSKTKRTPPLSPIKSWSRVSVCIPLTSNVPGTLMSTTMSYSFQRFVASSMAPIIASPPAVVGWTSSGRKKAVPWSS